jgi:cytochrome bd ubiquinol oxidase subunit I
VPPWAHFGAAILVAVGTFSSSFWILAVNSWMQTPQGHELIDGRFFPKDWFAIIFSPSFPYRLAHTVNAFFITTGLVVVAVGAYHLRNGRFVEEGRRMMSMTLWLLTVLVPLQIFIGDAHGLNTLEHQPAKIAAMEANWDTQRRMPLLLFAIPDDAAERNTFEIGIPWFGSLILTHSFDGEVKGLKEWPKQDRPPVAIPFFAFRVMVGAGVLMLGLVALSWWLRWREDLYDTRWFLNACMLASPLGFVAVIAGWCVTEVGRQPWTVYGLLRTAESVTPSLTSFDVAMSLASYMVVYLLIYPWGLFLMLRIVRKGPGRSDELASPIEGGRPQAPVLAGALGLAEGETR